MLVSPVNVEERLRKPLWLSRSYLSKSKFNCFKETKIFNIEMDDIFVFTEQKALG